MHVLLRLCAALCALFALNAHALSLRETSSQRNKKKEATPGPTSKVSYSVKVSNQEFKTFPGGGGQLKALDPTEITGNTMGFAYLELTPGGVRELHWHPLSAEWTYVLEGSCSFNVMNNVGQYTNGVANAGDVWYFAESFGHTLQGLDPDLGCKMVLFFDAPQTPVYNDLAISEMMFSFPVDVLSENLNTPKAVIESFPQEIVLVNQGPFPPPRLTESTNPLQTSPVFTVENGWCKDLGKGGYIYEVKNDIFPAATTMSGGFIHLETGSLRAIHWHPNADEMQYVISGSLKVSVYGVGGLSDTYVIEAGDIGFVPKGFAHYLEAVDGPTELLVTFNDPSWQNQELSTWMAVTPRHLTAISLETTEKAIADFPKSTELFYGDVAKECPRAVRH